jgi:hypothetical protein
MRDQPNGSTCLEVDRHVTDTELSGNGSRQKNWGFLQNQTNQPDQHLFLSQLYIRPAVENASACVKFAARGMRTSPLRRFCYLILSTPRVPKEGWSGHRHLKCLVCCLGGDVAPMSAKIHSLLRLSSTRRDGRFTRRLFATGCVPAIPALKSSGLL